MDEPHAKRARGEGMAPTDPRIRPHAPIAAASAAAVAIKQQSYAAGTAAPASAVSAAFPLTAAGFSASATSAQLSPAMQMALVNQLQQQVKQLTDEKAELQLKREFWRDEESKQRQVRQSRNQRNTHRTERALPSCRDRLTSSSPPQQRQLSRPAAHLSPDRCVSGGGVVCSTPLSSKLPARRIVC